MRFPNSFALFACAFSAQSNQSVFPARRHSKKGKGFFIMKKLTALLLSL